jgi:hypothetical protein
VDEVIRLRRQSHLFGQLPAGPIDGCLAGTDVTARQGIHHLRIWIPHPATLLQQHEADIGRLPGGPDEDGTMPVVIAMYILPRLPADHMQVVGVENVEQLVVSQWRRRTAE